MTTDLKDLIQRMSPETLSQYKEQLKLRTKSLAPEQLETVFERIRGIPELSDIVGEGVPPKTTEEPSWWQRAWGVVTTPLQWIQEKVVEPFAAIVTSPWSPKIAGTAGMGWLEREMAEYEKWEAPWGVKFAVETLPWLALPTGAGMIGRLGGLAAKLGSVAARGGAVGKAAALGAKAATTSAKALKPVAAVEKAVAYPITKPLELAAKKLAPKVAQVSGRLLPDLQTTEAAITTSTQPSAIRALAKVSIAGRRPLAGIAKLITGRAAAARNPAELSIVARDVLRFEGANKAVAAISTLERLGPSKRLFNLGDDMLVRSGPLKGTHIETLRTYPRKYADLLTTEQKTWLEQSSNLHKEITSLLERNKIEIRKLSLDEGGEWAGRRVMGKLDSEGNMIPAYIGRTQPARPGARAAMEKTRVFESAEEATAAGFRYLLPEEATYYNIVSAYNRVADKQWGDWFLSRVPHRTVAVTGMAAASRAEMREIQAALKQINSIALRLKNREKIPGQLLKGIKEYYPKEYEQLKLLTKQVKPKQAEVDSLLRFVRGQQGFYKKEWGETLRYFKEARSSAVRPGFTGTMAPDIPAFAGKVFTGPEAKEYIRVIREGLDPSFNKALGAINQMNAVGRFFALAGDMSPFGIQLIFLAGAHPTIYGKAIGGFIRAFFDPEYQAKFLARHINTIQKHPGLIISKGGTTEMTEAMANWGLLRRKPLSIGGKVLTPFQRGYESALDTAGVYMAEAYEHMCISATRTAQVDAFINEFRGLFPSKKVGITGVQRQLESSVVLAPQYNRAIAALMTDLARGGLRGDLARNAVTKGTAAIIAMAVAVSYAMGDSEEEMRERLNPLSADFLTWDVAGQRVGPGSKVRSVLATLGKMIEDPDETAYYAQRFLRGNFSPFLGTSVDLVTGKNYVGDPTRDGLLSFSRAVVGENLLPIWVQSVMFEEGDLKQKLLRGTAEFGGGRAYPLGAYGELKALQDRIARAEYGMSWDELGASPQYGKLYQTRLTKEHPELQELSEKAAEESDKWAHGEQLIWNEYNERVDQINKLVSEEINQAATQFEQTLDGSRFRERINRAFWLKAEMRQNLLEEEAFSMIKDYYSQPLGAEAQARMSPQDLAYREYNDVMYSADMYDQFGEYRFDEADRRRQALIQKYGIDTMNYIEAMIGEGRVDEPSALQVLREARVLLEPYWNIESQIWAQYSPEYKELADLIRTLEDTEPDLAKRYLMAYPQIMQIRKMIAQYRKQIRAANPQMDYALRLFYS